MQVVNFALIAFLALSTVFFASFAAREYEELGYCISLLDPNISAVPAK